VYRIMRLGVELVLKLNLHVKKKKKLIALGIFVASNTYAQYFNFNSCIPWPFSSSDRRKHLADVYIRVRAKRSRFFVVATGAFEIILGLQLRYTNLFS
jgi:hypothetical protein